VDLQCFFERLCTDERAVMTTALRRFLRFDTPYDLPPVREDSPEGMEGHSESSPFIRLGSVDKDDYFKAFPHSDPFRGTPNQSDDSFRVTGEFVQSPFKQEVATKFGGGSGDGYSPK